MDVESELKKLDSEVKALKAGYPVVASKLKTYVTTSQEFTVSGSSEVRIKFTPYYGTGKLSFTTLRAIATVEGVPSGYNLPFVNQPQDGSGEVIIRIGFEQTGNYKIRVVASGASPGSFSMI